MYGYVIQQNIVQFTTDFFTFTVQLKQYQVTADNEFGKVPFITLFLIQFCKKKKQKLPLPQHGSFEIKP